jgi:hypothetical protein
MATTKSLLATATWPGDYRTLQTNRGPVARVSGRASATGEARMIMKSACIKVVYRYCVTLKGLYAADQCLLTPE